MEYFGSKGFRMSVAAALAALFVAWSFPAQAQDNHVATRSGDFLPKDLTTPPSGTVIDCLLVEARAGKLFFVKCTALYTGLIVQVSELTAGFLICKNLDAIRCPESVRIDFEPDQGPLDAAEPFVCTVHRRTYLDDMSFDCVQ